MFVPVRHLHRLGPVRRSHRFAPVGPFRFIRVRVWQGRPGEKRIDLTSNWLGCWNKRYTVPLPCGVPSKATNVELPHLNLLQAMNHGFCWHLYPLLAAWWTRSDEWRRHVWRCTSSHRVLRPPHVPQLPQDPDNIKPSLAVWKSFLTVWCEIRFCLMFHPKCWAKFANRDDSVALRIAVNMILSVCCFLFMLSVSVYYFISCVQNSGIWANRWLSSPQRFETYIIGAVACYGLLLA